MAVFKPVSGIDLEEDVMDSLQEIGRIKYPRLFEPIKINNIEFKNRIYFPPFGVDLADEEGNATDELIDFYVDIAKSGCGLVILSNASVSFDSQLNKNGLKIFSKSHMTSLKNLVKKLRSYDVKVGIALHHYGRQGVTSDKCKAVLAPSSIPCSSTMRKDPNYKIKEMTLEDIERVKNDYKRAVEISAEADFDVVMLQASGGYLLNNFLSSYTNLRNDEYGGSEENRSRFLVEIIESARNILKDNKALFLRLGVDDCLEDNKGLKPIDFNNLIPKFEKYGVDVFTVALGIAENVSKIYSWSNENANYIRNTTKIIKSYSRVPIGFEGFTDSLEIGEELIVGGISDFVGVGRALFADNELIYKLLNDKKNINKCKWDLNCLRDKKNSEFNRVYCCVNPKYKRPEK
jgi:2,4-dienoyl-CoA reductase-like NADH-dependent reductase (Old Yellow Enzyme family)